MRIRILLILSSLSLLAAASAKAQENAATLGEPVRTGHQSLRGHTFIRPTLQQSAMVATYVGISEGVASYTVHDFPASILGLRRVKLYGLQQTIGFGFTTFDWLGFDVSAQGSGLLGADAQSLLLQGASFDVAGEGSMAVRVLRNEESGTQITLRALGGIGSGRDLTVLPLLRNVIDSPGGTLDAIASGQTRELIVVPVSSKNLGGGIYAAQAFGRAFSLQGSLAGRALWMTESPFDVGGGAASPQDSTGSLFTGALAGTVDFMAWKVPIAFLGEYRLNLGHHSSRILGSDIQNHTAGLGVYYTGREHLELGIFAATLIRSEPLIGFGSDNQLASTDNIRAQYAQLVLRYAW